ncbi:hypothetical protein N136_00495 [Leifsonia aquatica ATCC 14665]|uniref:Uncharacterized protein n=1 Tax=Leifsonia aquatica ATCC 14665 TaxID=1358026 RepID=U2TEJ2_LEIAQ|nr:hypothetical protein N136_00495 [Leifsonia aquatica ATCC 14665]
MALTPLPVTDAARREARSVEDRASSVSTVVHRCLSTLRKTPRGRFSPVLISLWRVTRV